jgi:hypothetical protein
MQMLERVEHCPAYLKHYKMLLSPDNFPKSLYFSNVLGNSCTFV